MSELDQRIAVKNRISDYVSKNADRISSLFRAHDQFSRFIASCIIELNQIKKPDEIIPESGLIAVCNAAHIGLIPGKVTGHAYFIPRKGRVNLEVGYKGFIWLGMTSGFIKSIHAEVILRDEKFEHWVEETGPKIRHSIPLDRDTSPSNITRNAVGAYCVYQTESGSGMRVVNRQDIQKVNTGRDVWASDPYSMFRKTPIRRASNDWQLSSQLENAIRVDDMNASDKIQGLLEEIKGKVVFATEKGGFSLDDIEDEAPESVAGGVNDSDAVF